MFAQWAIRVAALMAALFLTVSPQSQDVRDVARAYLQRHGVPCLSVTHIDRSGPEMEMTVVCQDGREWVPFFFEGEVAFVHPQTREHYRWRRDVYSSYPEVYVSPDWIAEDI